MRHSVGAAHDEAGITAGTEGGDLVITVELLADAVAQGVRAVPEQLVERRDVVAVERFFVAVEGSRHLGHDRRDIDLHVLSLLLQAGAETQTPCFSR